MAAVGADFEGPGMRFLVDADLPRRTAGLIRSYGHESEDVRDVGLGGAGDGQVAEYARAQRMCLLTGDFGFADIRVYPPEDYAGIVVLGLPEVANRDFNLRLVEAFLRETAIVERLRSRLAIVEAGRVRLRPA